MPVILEWPQPHPPPAAAGPLGRLADAVGRRLAAAAADPRLEIRLRLDPAAPVALHIRSGPAAATLVGREPSDLSGGAYWFLEQLGFLFEFSCEYPPEVPVTAFPTLDRTFDLPIRQRGIRLHLNFVQDPSCFSEEEFEAYVDRLPTLRLNYLLFHMYPNQEWFPFTYRGVEQLDLAVGNLERKPLRPDMIGRDRIQVRDHWFPREFEDIRDPQALRDAMHGRYRRMMARARELGLVVAASFEPESVGGSFADRLAEWSTAPAPPGGGQAGLLADAWQQDWSGSPLAEADVRHPILRDLAVGRALSLLDAYPELDELHLISREGASFRMAGPEAYGEELGRIARRFGLPPDCLDLGAIGTPVTVADPIVAANPRTNPYWTVAAGETRHATVTAVLRFLEFARDILDTPSLAARLARDGIRPVVTVYAPDPDTVRLVAPAAARILPEGQAFHLLADYGARDITRGFPGWAPLLPKLDVGLVTWLEFDGSMMLAQDWGDALVENIRTARTLGIDTQVVNHWRVRSNEHNARAAADAMWDPDADPEALSESYFRALYGPGASALARTAYRSLEAATILAKERTFNVGFTADWVVRICTEPPGYYWRHLRQVGTAYREATAHFDALASLASQAPVRTSSRGASQARYMADLCRISALHLSAVHHLQMAKLPLVGFRLWPLPAQDPPGLPPPDFLAALLREARAGLELEYEYMRILAGWTRTCDEQGQLAMHQQGLIEPYEELAAALTRWVEQEAGRAPG